MTQRPLVSLSVVSHGQGAIVRNLLLDLRSLSDVSHEIILTINVPEDMSFLSGFDDLPLRVLHSPGRRGFGANHNAAFARSTGVHFAVVNPDIRAPALRLAPLVETLQHAEVGACAPEVVSPDGSREDSARRYPSFTRLFERAVLHKRKPDYAWDREPVRVDWVAGMFVMFRRDSFSAVGGFDERYFMYMEDADICRRLRGKGLHVVLNPAVSVVHDAQRASHRDLRHLLWHLRSAYRFLLAPRLPRSR